MKHRYLNTNYWNDSYISHLDNDERNLFLFLFSNSYVTKCGIYELPDKYILPYSNIDLPKLQEIKKKFESDRKYFFFKDWIYVNNFYKHNSFSPTIHIAQSVKKEFDAIPIDIKKHFFADFKLKPMLSFNKGKDFIIKWKKDMVMVMVMVIESPSGQGGGHPMNEDVDPDSIPDDL